MKSYLLRGCDGLKLILRCDWFGLHEFGAESVVKCELFQHEYSSVPKVMCLTQILKQECRVLYWLFWEKSKPFVHFE